MGTKFKAATAVIAAVLSSVAFTGVAKADQVCYDPWISGDGHTAELTCNYVNGYPRYYFTMTVCSAGGCTTQGSYTVSLGQRARLSTGGYISGTSMTVYGVN
ncbi:hypothetical protein LFM09_49230 [Lentzea alba]|uniref:hypothetical protein n=1 Tax=Lentzea alba TaxID=2714351 RepID=UPI0039BFD9AB